MCSHVPNREEQMVRYYGHYSNVKRGKRKKEDRDDVVPNIIEESTISPAQRKAWARLIQKIYEVDLLTCPKCQGSMKIIAFIEQAEIMKKILKHLGLWHVKTRPPPKIHSPPEDFFTDYPDSQIPPWDDDYSLAELGQADPDYPFEAYM